MATTIPLWAAMAVEQRRATRTAATLAPRRDRSRTACWYAKRARPTAEGGRHRALHRSAPARRASCVLPWDGCRQSLRRAAHPTWPIPSLDQGDVWSLQPCGLGRRAYTTTGPMARRCRRNPAKGVQTGALQARMTAKLRSCLALLYQPCFALPCLGGRLSGLLSAGLRQHRRASLADAQRDAEFHVAGCRCAVGCGWRGVGSCRDDWKSLERAWGAIT
jgi:hypothetical protein